MDQVEPQVAEEQLAAEARELPGGLAALLGDLLGLFVGDVRRHGVERLPTWLGAKALAVGRRRRRRVGRRVGRVVAAAARMVLAVRRLGAGRAVLERPESVAERMASSLDRLPERVPGVAGDM